MLIFLYFCTGFAIATAVVSMANVWAFAWHGVKERLKTGESGNLRGRLLIEMIMGWIVLGFSISVIILLSNLYP